MPLMRIGLFLPLPGRQDRGGEIVDAVLERAAAAPGYEFGLRIRGRVGHGDRWQGWITAWDDRASMQAAADATTELADEMRTLSEPRTCQEVMLDTEATESATRAVLASIAAAR